jgi:NAD(P)H-dependent flavin oxidoreductase YrpB (nitropropane dioxygenase family)
MTAESPVPAITTDRYRKAGVGDITVTSQVDGMPQRVIVNELVRHLESSNRLELFVRALHSALQFRKVSGASISELLRSGFAMRRHERLSRAQMLMAANAPMLAKKAMSDGDPVNGYLPSGTVAGVIDDLPTCAELVERIMHEAELTLAALAK